MQHAKYVRRPLFVVSSKANLSIVSSILRGIDWKVTFYHCRHVKEYVHTFMDIFNSIDNSPQLHVCLSLSSFTSHSVSVYFPSAWKSAGVVPIYKGKGLRNQASSYIGL